VGPGSGLRALKNTIVLLFGDSRTTISHHHTGYYISSSCFCADKRENVSVVLIGK
jgi:hypothetical protein